MSVPGVYAGWIHGFLFGDAFDKGLSFKMGQTHTQRSMPELLGKISNGKLKPEAIVTHRMSLADAARGYQIFNDQRGLPQGRADRLMHLWFNQTLNWLGAWLRFFSPTVSIKNSQP